MRFSRFTTIGIVFFFPIVTFAQTELLSSQETLSELNLLIAQYEARIKQLQSENAVLRYEMAKAGIKIPLTDLSGSTTPIPTAVTPTSLSTPQVNTGITNTGTQSTASSLTPKNIDVADLKDITAQYGKDVAGFISRVNKDWSGIQGAYKLPKNSRIAGYEFVQTGSMDHVFVDIVVGTGMAGIYDIKLLYLYEKSEYKRKLIGIFDYNASTARYITRMGNNPFGGVERVFVRDPYYAGAVTIPTSSLPITSPSTTSNTGVTSTSITPTVSPSTPTSTPSGGPTVAEITKAYNEKRYLSTITLSNSFLEKNPATQDILNIRYRTYFIIGKYSESLAELAKIEKLGSLDKQTSCNAQVIATYSKNQSLIDKYAALCKK